MRSARPSTPKCFFVAWVFGWVTAIYVPSFLIAVTALSPLATGKNLLAEGFAVADEVAPAAKLAFAILFAIGLMIARVGRTRANAVHMAMGVAAMLLVIALLPQYLSRGFGIGLVGTRFAALPTAIYLVGGLLSGLAFSVSETRCFSRSVAPRP